MAEFEKGEVTIEKLNSRGCGLGRFGGKIIFVPWGIPGDRLFVQIEKKHHDYNEARLLQIVEKSPDRVEPPCPYFFVCGGCQLQQMSYEAQLKWKRQIVVDAVRRISRISLPEIPPVIPSPKVWNYRSRIRLHRDRKGRVGFYKAGSHEVVEIEKCLIADERLNEKLKSQIPNSKLQEEFELRVDGCEAFSQVNVEQNEKLVGLVVKWAALEGKESVIDLYCGGGSLTFPLAAKARTVIGIDRDIHTISEAISRSATRGVRNIRWIQGSAFQVLLGFKKEGLVVDLLVMDPPRRGVAEAIEGVFSLKPKRIVYVSCNPATFARDTARLVREGYHLTSCQPLDMFPHTAHIEVVGLFLKI